MHSSKSRPHLFARRARSVALLGITAVLAACGNSTSPQSSSVAVVEAQTSTLSTAALSNTGRIIPVVANEEYVLRNPCGGKVLDVQGVSTAEGANVQVYSFNGFAGSLNQRWTVIPLEGGYFKLIAKHSGKSLDVSGGGSSDLSNVQQWSFAGNPQQQWKFSDAGNGYYKLSPRNAPGKFLDVNEASAADGANVQIYGGNTSCAQNWKLETYASLASYSAPLRITKGGTYSGNWQSLDPNTPAVTIATSEPVTLENCLIRSKGHLIDAGYPSIGSNLTVQNCRGYGLNPDVVGKAPGRFFNGFEVDSLKIVGNYLASTSGIYLNKLRDASTGTITIQKNQARNIDGRKSDGNGGWSSNLENGFEPVQFVMFNTVSHVVGADISWNEVINQPYFSRVEDNINMYNSSGTPNSRINIQNNYIQGAYPADLSDASALAYSGGGILLCDCYKGVVDPGYMHASDNQVVGTLGYGISIDGGLHSEVDHNRVVVSNLRPDGTRIVSPRQDQNITVGYTLWDYQNLANAIPRVYGDNTLHDNVSGATNYLPDGSVFGNEWWVAAGLANNSSASNWTYISNVTLAAEAAEYQTWLSKLTSSNKSIGTH